MPALHLPLSASWATLRYRNAHAIHPSCLPIVDRNQVNQLCVCVCLQECVLNHRLEPLGMIEGFAAEVGASGTFCPSHMTFPVDVSFYSVSEDNAPSPYMVRRRPFWRFSLDRVRGRVREGDRASARSDSPGRRFLFV